MGTESWKKGLRSRARGDVRNAKHHLENLQRGIWFSENKDELSFALDCAMCSLTALEKVVKGLIEKEIDSKRIADDYVRDL